MSLPSSVILASMFRLHQWKQSPTLCFVSMLAFEKEMKQYIETGVPYDTNVVVNRWSEEKWKRIYSMILFFAWGNNSIQGQSATMFLTSEGLFSIWSSRQLYTDAINALSFCWSHKIHLLENGWLMHLGSTTNSSSLEDQEKALRARLISDVNQQWEGCRSLELCWFQIKDSIQVKWPVDLLGHGCCLVTRFNSLLYPTTSGLSPRGKMFQQSLCEYPPIPSLLAARFEPVSDSLRRLDSRLF